MELKVYDKSSFNNDKSANSFYTYIQSQFGDREGYCLYKEPDYYTNADILPTFTIVDKDYGVIVIKIYDHSSDSLTEINDRFWEIDGVKHHSEIIHFEDYCYKFENDINMPTNEIYSQIGFSKFIVFPQISKDDIKINLRRKNVNILFEDYRSFDLKKHLHPEKIDDEDWNKLISVIQKANVLSKDVGFALEKPLTNLREAIAFNNQKIHQFDDTQLDASLTITDEAERIRGLAGTGKTVILAIKAARLHRKNPDAKIVYTFSTHSLYNQVRRLVSKYYKKITGEEPNDNLKILHAWGGKTTGAGLYYNTCLKNNIVAHSVNDLRSYENPFAEACTRAIHHNLIEEYDYILIDEAQDMPIEFFKLVEKITKKPSKIIWAYDELQTTSNTRIPDTKELYGVDEAGNPKVPLREEYDYILKKSYRNHQNVLMLAFALGFGLYSNDGITQIIRDTETWNALGFDVKDNRLVPGEYTEINRPKENSPNNINEHFTKFEIVNYLNAETKSQELQNVANEIINLIKEEKVNPHDIMVIDMGNRPKNNLTYIQNILYTEGIPSLIPGLVDGAKDFLMDDFVTLTTVRRAKGNEVPIVFVVGAEKIYEYRNEYEKRILRNMIFISTTRSKGWLFISASGSHAKAFEEEYGKIVSSIPYYKFPFPTKEMLERIENLNMLSVNNKKVEELQNEAETLAKIVESGNLGMLEMFLDEKTKQKILEALTKSKK
ncbi:ATP-binding domain-containing protein [Brevibacillus formosus]|uniref:DNA helicase n=1 Tax=Brevibacillus formosus TaxID=54913 RepID=A0A837KPC4_9BACL|nr:ATP-binding domain-containing protein [Brevibacillus formosus]KLH99404.1 hypothetical protein AA984_12990 [Brevibacillus formosus]MED1956824.1 ATP-binding domain-containing protein [Brevibacillus formosus]PSJ92947.1 DUF2075 domain-containing protein [Brevibacillus formosus]GED57222.1 hypothetical protein BFO01nite_13540 [Brevibacillus formosus]